jgi:hypothetical protein
MTCEACRANEEAARVVADFKTGGEPGTVTYWGAALAETIRALRSGCKCETVSVLDDVDNLRRALRFYANGWHFSLSEPGAWDTVSGEPQNYYCDEHGTATVEDGSIAKMALRGELIEFKEEGGVQTTQPPDIVGEVTISASQEGAKR